MAKKRTTTKKREVSMSVSRTTRRPQTREQIDEEEEVCWIAAIYCLRTFPTLWTVGDIREEPSVSGLRRWIVAVHVRYPTGHEGYVGDLLVEGGANHRTHRPRRDEPTRAADRRGSGSQA